MNLNTLRDICHNAAKEKGWYSPPPAELEAKFVANVHGEVSEFWEAHRKGTLDQPCDKPCGLTCREEEMADILIRVFDMAGCWGVDLDHAVSEKLAYNRTRPARHGGKVA
jgi:NTP pyrophosphatase (non-canonical NTP hydrolase)